eukprot:1184001-Prorocentrum_minimum.AAC.1
MLTSVRSYPGAMRWKQLGPVCALLGVAMVVGFAFTPRANVSHDTQSHDPGVSYELLQVVSSTDDSLHPGLRRLPIETVHKQGLPHRGSIIFVMNEHHELLLLRRAPTMKTCANSWAIVGEHSEPGEDYIETARRGLREMLSLMSEQILKPQSRHFSTGPSCGNDGKGAPTAPEPCHPLSARLCVQLPGYPSLSAPGPRALDHASHRSVRLTVLHRRRLHARSLRFESSPSLPNPPSPPCRALRQTRSSLSTALR